MGLGMQISWQAQDFFVDLQDFVGRFRGRCRTLWPWSADFVAVTGVFGVEV